MSFGGFPSKSSGENMVADGLFSYNVMSTAANSMQMFSSPPLSLALPKMENLGGMGLLGESHEGGLIGRMREDELESRSGSDNFEGASGDDDNPTHNKASKRKKYHRHTAFQIQELEASFKDNPHPDEKARLELGKRLSLEGRQVKFWFQNRRTQMKTQLERHENSILKQENDKLRIENIAMKEAMRSPMCENCGSPAILGDVPIEQHHLMIENARLKDELSRLHHLGDKFLGRTNGSMPPPLMSNSSLDLSVGRNGFVGMNSMDAGTGIPLGLDFGNRMSNSFPIMPPNGPPMNMVNSSAPFDKSLFVELAMAGINELIKLAQLDSPLWFRSLEGNGESLNLEEYSKMFSPCIGVKPNHFVTEATRATCNVMINSMQLVEALMDPKQWTELFPWNIGSASILDIISPGMAGSKNGMLQLMQAEFQIPSPLVPVRQVKLIRFCKQHGEDMWAVVDISVDSLLHAITGNVPVHCRRLPSGCIVQDTPNGYSKVTWIEHTEYDERITHQLYRPLLRSGIAFGAQKWLSNLHRQCELFASIMSSGGDNSVVPPSGKKGIVKLAQRMTRAFCSGICSTVDEWEVVQDADNTKLMTRKSSGNSGAPPGVILSASTTEWMPVSPQHLLDFLQDEKTRSHWDVLSQDGPMRSMLRLPKGHNPDNYISILQTSAAASADANQSNVLILQETSGDSLGAVVVHAAVPAAEMDVVMSGGDPAGVPILPSGFAIFPDCFPESGNSGGGGSLLSIGFQILVSNLPAAQLTVESVNTVKSLIARTHQGIKGGLQCN
ncbi:homeobox-leucine zipper protein ANTHOCYANINLESS 2 isoform X1 [Salvia hispanica]|uniref:homeobox-leucine zipper protein ANTHOCYANINLESS 2 isoform X1 n=2 Tax=Salvia hispanica TaxID=49212 RepID=UPI00200968F2|nr:homeobox-leucine zipper protein ANTHOCYANINLESS 2 isoform X1 [Salvia hispanica]